MGNPGGGGRVRRGFAPLTARTVASDGFLPNEAIIADNVACYECQLGNRGMACKWLESAVDLADPKEVKLMALQDPDLEKFRAEIGEI